ncbi:hypothetical protein ABL78_1909 [Leptomonas seymouri]|uniref:Uncharacterized protein n=1 Tax=Leptomonas seymouri TaxID=5684 RepID=A0A0N1I9W7_LEPSE|nr:hypothetical protein ABL78_1909 [Leptomonas seymouri]|eukprot:KPI88943.1 hypothetical protein ABL78_1909 [Leptomonas seymouri]
MQVTKGAPILTVQSVVQGLASDSAFLLSLVTTIERTATPEQKAAFVRHFVSLLLLCRDEGIFAGSELLCELLLLELDEAMWHQRDAAAFLCRPSTVVSCLLGQLSLETFTSPEGNLLPRLVASTRVLSAGDDASTTGIATPMGVSLGAWSHHSEDGPLAPAAEPDGMSVYDRFSTSELAGLSSAEQQFFSDVGPSPLLVHSFSSSVGGTGMEGSRPPLQASSASLNQQQQGPRAVSPPYSFNSRGPAALSPAATSSSGLWDSFRYTGDTDTTRDNSSRPATRPAFTGVQMREAIDFFSDASAIADSKSVHGAELALNVVDVRAEAVLALAFQIQEVVAKHISDCPLVLRRAFWLWLRATSGRSGPPESAEVLPERHVTMASSEAHMLPPHPLSSAPAPAKSSLLSPSLSFEFVGMATMVMQHMLTPLLLSIPSFVLPVEEDEASDAYVTTTTRFRFMAKVLQKAAYGVLFDEIAEAGLTPLNRGMRELHRRWVSCFSALADYRNASSMNWCCPLPSPTRGFAVSLAGQAEERAVVLRYFQFLDGFLVPYLQTTVLLRRFSEAIHLPQWLRCTHFGARFARGQMGGRCTATALPPSPQRAGTGSSYAGDRNGNGIAAFAAVTAASSVEKDVSEEEKQLRMGTAVSHVVGGLSTATSTNTTQVVSAFMTNFISFLGTNDAKVTTVVIYEDLLRRYWAQFQQSDKTDGTAAPTERAEAAAVLSFYIYLAVQHNVVSPRFRLVLIPSVSAALRSAGQHAPFSSFAFSTNDTIQWIWQVVEGVPVLYRQHCDGIWSAAIASGNRGLDLEQEKAFASTLPHMPRLTICSSFSELMSCVLKGMSCYIPLSADDYHWMVCEQQQQQKVPSLSAVPFTKVAAHSDAYHRCKEQHNDPVATTSDSSTVSPQHCFSAISSALANTTTLRSLRARWRRPLAVSESLSASGILPLHSTRSLFEVFCTITCRRLWTDGSLQPMTGVSALGALTQPLCSITQLYGMAADVAATLLVAVDATPPPRWLRDLYFSHGSVSVRVCDVEDGSGRVSSTTPIAPGASMAVMQQIEQVHWPLCAWFYPTAEDSDADGEPSSAASLCTQWESLMQHVLFFSSEFDANVPDYNTDSNVAEQILSTRWGLRGGGGGGESATVTPSAPPAGEGKSTSNVTAALTSLHAVPSLRHLSIESLWRLFLFNVRQTCHIMRRTMPRECPFCRMEGAIANVLCGGRTVRRPPTVAVRPGLDEGISTFSDRISQAAADALRSCFPSEVTIVRLIVSVAAYIRNVYTVIERLRESGAVVPASVTPASYKVVVRDGTAQLLYGTAPLTAVQKHLVDLLCFDGDSLMRKAYLPYFENCTWHPYGRLLYDC